MIPIEYQGMLAPFMEPPPTDVLGAARALGLAVYSTPLPAGISGVLARDPSYGTASGFVILVDENEPVVRQRFSAAHELGHYILHRDSIGERVEDNYMLRAAGMTSLQETEANRFAADLLMPREAVSLAMSEGFTTVDQLAGRFNVSRLAMGIRLGLPT